LRHLARYNARASDIATNNIAASSVASGGVVNNNIAKERQADREQRRITGLTKFATPKKLRQFI
jgi:hypothetical protein